MVSEGVEGVEGDEGVFLLSLSMLCGQKQLEKCAGAGRCCV